MGARKGCFWGFLSTPTLTLKQSQHGSVRAIASYPIKKNPAFSRSVQSINQSAPLASKGSPPVRGAGYEPLLLTPEESQETPTQPRRSRQQRTTTEQERAGAPSAVFIISTSKQSQTRRQTDTLPATPSPPPAVNRLTYLPDRKSVV